jgi:hypothetical protein
VADDGGRLCTEESPRPRCCWSSQRETADVAKAPVRFGSHRLLCMRIGVVWNPDGAYVIANNGIAGQNFSGPAVRWGGRIGRLGTFFADANGDGKADMIAVDITEAGTMHYVAVSLSTGSTFATSTYWTNYDFYGRRGMYVADMNGDGKADVIRNVSIDLNPMAKAMEVRLSNGAALIGFDRPNIDLPAATVGSRGFFADVTGPDSDGKSRADYIYYGDGGVHVNKNGTAGFTGGTRWLQQTGNWLGTTQDPPLPLLFADVNGDGKDDYIATFSSATSKSAPTLEGISVYYSNGSSGFATTPGVRLTGLDLARGIGAAKCQPHSGVRTPTALVPVIGIAATTRQRAPTTRRS